ncbi:unnamed protein product [Prorocentrum cordatum]|uniref:Fibronectin type III-like domain-containing protein n=1 Tax=Prorocentrum cordatum TaxID=2364126 RepID=A0ABN9TST0_9DINO|nr:unnamed protein product [Polarella glacialis]
MASRRVLSALLAAAVAVPLRAATPLPFRYACTEGHRQFPFCDASLPLARRVDDLVSRLSLDEKPQLMEARFSPRGNISRLGVPQYDWGANCIHGVESRCGSGGRCPTPFPNPNFLGAAFNETVWHGMGRVIGRELRSLWRQGVGENHPPTELPPVGLDCWSPNVNIVRDPRWGRNLETPGEDPFLLGRFGVAVTQGLQQGEDPRYLQAVVTLKHFVANSLEGAWPGPGGPARFPGKGLCPGGSCTRHTIDPNISAYDLASSYFPAFRSSVVEGGALGVMCSYNAVNGVPSCANKWLLGQKLREEWGFQGYVTGDSGAVEDIYRSHWYVASMEDAVAAAVQAGTDVQSAGWGRHGPWAVRGEYITMIPELVRSGKLSEAALDAALKRTLSLRFRLGLFDPPAAQAYEHFAPNVVRSEEHVRAALDAAEQGFVLLQNRNRTLPISGGVVAVIGPHAGARYGLLGNYLGQTCPELTAKGGEQYGCVQSIAEALGNLTTVLSAPGLPSVTSEDRSLFDGAVQVAKQADHVVLALGLDTSSIEAEGTDRKSIALPAGQVALFDAVRAAGKRVTVVLLNGGAVAMSHVKEHADAIVEAWYPGFYGGRALARALLGITNRWGKLPVTVYDEDFEKQFDMLDFDMTKGPGRTYRYFTGEPLWPFGHGLSYTTFALRLLSAAKVDIPQRGGQTTIRVEVTNTGDREGDEVVMAFFSPRGAAPRGSRAALLRRQLFGFRRVSLRAGESAAVEFAVGAETLALFADSGDRVSHAGAYALQLTSGAGAGESVAAEVVAAEGEPQPVLLEAWAPRARAARAALVV